MTDRLYLHEDGFWEKAVYSLGGRKAGVYRLYGSDDGSPVPIPRLMGEEPSGLLYIGGSDDAAVRATKLRGGIMALYGGGGLVGKPHSAGWKMEAVEGFTTKFRFDGFYLIVEPCDEFFPDGRAWFRRHECRLIEQYRQRWGDTPPLNG